MSRRVLCASFVVLLLTTWSKVLAQSPGAIYTWDASGNPTPHVENWAKNFGANNAVLDNTTPGVLTIVENGTAGEDIAIRPPPPPAAPT